jgi:hypothetical protein
MQRVVDVNKSGLNAAFFALIEKVIERGVIREYTKHGIYDNTLIYC